MVTTQTYRELEARWKALRARGVRVREVACVGAPRTMLCAELGEAPAPVVALAAGVHGDEPAGPWALLALVESERLDPHFSYRIWPCTNPSGFALGTRANADGADVNRTFAGAGSSPEAKAILTANRDRRFALSLDLHEDCDANGFYCYEYGGGTLGCAVLAALEEAGHPLDPLEATFDLAGPLDPQACVRERGRIVADLRAEAAAIGAYSYSMRLARRAARFALTFESPAAAAWEDRLAMHGVAVQAAIAALRRVNDYA
ncbi:MAG TPA: succinylglutamate desuccinylase/aspartoacylase family protein [Verrucomicrobiae bacterium]|nr:succinylglutamate desuccinylase/aspartoacylase family protein [Verrucomicrobiae bacterium]